LPAKLHEVGASVNVVGRSEREDWIQSLVAGGLGVAFLLQPFRAAWCGADPDRRDITRGEWRLSVWSALAVGDARPAGAGPHRPQAQDARAAARLWDVSAAFTGQCFDVARPVAAIAPEHDG